MRINTFKKTGIMAYIASKLTTYDADDLLWYTKIGYNDPQMTLYCIVAGKSIEASRARAENLLFLLNSLEKDVKEP